MKSFIFAIMAVISIVFASQAHADCPNKLPENPGREIIRGCFEEISLLKDRLNALERKGNVVTLPLGAVVAFDIAEGCPREGWVPFNEAQGRVVVGSRDGGFEFRTRGGSPTVVVGPQNLPEHYHDTQLGVLAGEAQYGPGPAKRAVAGAGMGTFLTAFTGPAGSKAPEPISIIQPFIALTYCKKIS